MEGGSLVLLEEDISSDVLNLMINPYFPSCKYLKKAVFDNDNPITVSGSLSIPDSCYIESTGHFNAVEFMICFNQLAYVLIGESVRRGLLPELGFDSFEKYHEVQLRSSYITRVKDVIFRKPIDTVNFNGHVQINRQKKLGDNNFYNMSASFDDLRGGKASGLVNIAIV